MFLLDTDVVCELRRSRTAHPLVAAWAETVPIDQLRISSITVLEIQRGILQATRKDSRQGAILQRWLHRIIGQPFAGRILDVDAEIALCCAGLHVPDPRPESCALVAATALVHDLTVVTRNAKDFEGTGVRVFDPWTAA